MKHALFACVAHSQHKLTGNTDWCTLAIVFAQLQILNPLKLSSMFL